MWTKPSIHLASTYNGYNKWKRKQHRADGEARLFLQWLRDICIPKISKWHSHLFSKILQKLCVLLGHKYKLAQFFFIRVFHAKICCTKFATFANLRQKCADAGFKKTIRDVAPRFNLLRLLTLLSLLSLKN